MIKRIGSAPAAPQTSSPQAEELQGAAPKPKARGLLAPSTFASAKPKVRSTVDLSGGDPSEPKLMKDVASSVRYQTVPGGQLFVDGLSYDDVTQGEAGDCYLLSSMSAVAASNPEAMKNAITDNGDGTYAVRFFQKSHGAAKPVTVTIDGQLPMDTSAKRPARDYASARDANELWPSLVEKAYAKWKGGYENIGEGGEAGDALFALTGSGSDYTAELSKANPETLWQAMRAASTAKHPMVAGTFDAKKEPMKYDEVGLVDGHAYTVLGASEENGERLVTLRNPWGNTGFKADEKPHPKNDGTFTMKYADFLKAYEDLYIMKAKA